MPATNELLQEGRYRIDHEISQNETGSVFEAYDTVGNSNVMVKEIPVSAQTASTDSQKEDHLNNFVTQAQKLTEIRHDALLSITDFFADVDRKFLVIEPVDGDDLSSLLGRNKRAFPVADVLNWADTLLDALVYLHSLVPPIVHCHIEPGNIRLNTTGQIKLLSVGFNDEHGALLDTAISSDAGRLKLINYSPMELIWSGLDSASQKVISNSYDENSERLLLEPADARTDLYSLGATLYHLITGQKPSDALERSIVILEGAPDPLRPPHKLDPRIPVEVSALLMKALEIKRQDRFESAQKMRDVLHAVRRRVDAREEEEALEELEAAEDIRMMQNARRSRNAPHTASSAENIDQSASASQVVVNETEMMKIKLREAEEQRKLAEERAAEAERQLRENEERKAAASAPARIDPADNLLELDIFGDTPSPNFEAAEEEPAAESHPQVSWADLNEEKPKKASFAIEDQSPAYYMEPKVDESEAPGEAEVVSYSASPTIALEEVEVVSDEPVVVEEADDDDQFLMEPEEAEVEHAREFDVEREASGVEVEEAEVVEILPEPVFAYHTDDDDDVFSSVEAPRSGLPIPMMAGAVVLVLAIAVGAWFMMSGGSPEKPAEPVAVQPVDVQPAVEQPAPQAEVPVQNSAAVPTEDLSQQPVVSDGQPEADRTTANPAAGKPKKVAPVPTPTKAPAEKKKAVTVDDLINDN